MTPKSAPPTVPSCKDISWRSTTLSLPKKLTSSTANLEWCHVHFMHDLYITFIRQVIGPSKNLHGIIFSTKFDFKYRWNQDWTACHHKHPGPYLNIKTVFPRYGDSLVKYKTVAYNSIALCIEGKTAISPVLMHWRYCSISLSHWYASLVHNCSISTANALEILQSLTKPLICLFSARLQYLHC